MSAMEHLAVKVTTDASGDATAYSSAFAGLIHAIAYEKVDYADGVDLTITEELTGDSIWTESNVNASELHVPRMPTVDGLGAASLYAAAGEPVEAPFPCMSRVKIVVAQGGNTKTGRFHILAER